MARPRVAEAPAASNVTDQLIADWIEKVREKKVIVDDLQEETRQAMGVYRSEIKAAKSAGVPVKAVLAGLKAEKIDLSELAIEERDRVRVFRLMGLPVGAQQGDLFAGESAGPAAVSPEAAHKIQVGQARDDGFSSGKAGHNRSANPHEAGSELYSVWDMAWLAGQSDNVQALAPAGRRSRRGRGIPTPVDETAGDGAETTDPIDETRH